MAKRAAQVIGGALGGSTLLLVIMWGVDEIHWRRIERNGRRPKESFGIEERG